MKLQLVLIVVVGCGGAREPAPHPADHRIQPAVAAACDDVSCVLADYRGACCQELRERPEKLDRAQFEATMSTFAGSADRCATEHHYDGYFVVSIQVDASGSVSSVGKPPALGSPLAPGLLACISDVVRTARFGKTRYGATLSYPFELHGIAK